MTDATVKPIWRQTGGAALAVFCFLIPVLSLTANKGLAVLLLVLCVAGMIWRRPAAWRVLLPYGVALAALSAWGLASAIWSIEPSLTVSRAGRVAGLLAAGLVLCAVAAALRRTERRAALIGLGAGMLLAVSAAVLYWYWLSLDRGGPAALPSYIPAFRPFSSVTAMLLFPVAGGLSMLNRRGWSAACILGVGAALVLIGAKSAVIALAAGLLVFLPALYMGRAVLRVLMVVLPLFAVATPHLIGFADLPARLQEWRITVPSSAAHRMVIWQFVQDRIDERPYLGWGLQTARVMPDGHADLNKDPRYRGFLSYAGYGPGNEIQALPMHPHNASFHLRLELGVPGLLLYGAIWLLLAVGLYRSRGGAVARAAGAAVLVSAFVTGQLSFSAWQSWWLSAQFLAAACVLMLLAEDAGQAESAGRAAA